MLTLAAEEGTLAQRTTVGERDGERSWGAHSSTPTPALREADHAMLLSFESLDMQRRNYLHCSDGRSSPPRDRARGI